jgi:hypothetical protein
MGSDSIWEAAGIGAAPANSGQMGSDSVSKMESDPIWKMESDPIAQSNDAV